MRAVEEQSEADIAAAAVAWLEAQGHDVYQEVECVGGVADIVCLIGTGREVWIIEVKRRWSLDLIAQCLDRRRQAHRVFACVPWSRTNHAAILQQLGIGTIIVEPASWVTSSRVGRDGRVHLHDNWMPPRLTSRADFPWDLRRQLRPGHKTNAKAGTPSGAGRYTPFRATCDALRAVVRDAEGITLKDAIARIDHHYSSPKTARSTLARFIESGVIEGLELRAEGRARCLYLKAVKA